MTYKLSSGLKRAKGTISGLAVALAFLAVPVTLALTGGGASAATPGFGLQPFEFVGTAAECGGTAGTDTVTAAWDSSTGNPAPSILLQKLGATSNCAAAGVDIITPLEGGPVANLTELNYDYKTGEHCGAGAPRFNIQTETGTSVLLGCASGTQTNLGNGWTHVEYNAAQIQSAVLTTGGTTLQDLYIIFDEGSDTPAGGTIGTPGTVHIDNISVNNTVVGSPTSPLTKEDCKNGGYQNLLDTNGQPFKNQGQCVSSVASANGQSHKH
jgi:hypothetical protein